MQKKKRRGMKKRKEKGARTARYLLPPYSLTEKKNLRVSGNRFTMMVEYSSSAEAPRWI
jgi:hypothetical protein